MTRRALRVKRLTTRKRNTRRNQKKRGGSVYDPMKYDTFTVDRYFQKLDLPASVQKSLMDRLKLDLNTLSKSVQEALDIKEEALKACIGRGGKAEATATRIEWKKCEGTCNTLITNAVNQEIGSTAFMLKLLADSVIRPDDAKHRLKIGLDPAFFEGGKGDKRSNKGANDSGCRLLTGQWKDDAPFLHLVLPPSKQGRLIMGFGPSASGKTHWAKTILRLLAQADAQFPEVFFAVDGGLVRESSAVYQFATEMAHCAGFAGFTNLHAGMFVTGDVKKAMEKYLLAESQRSPISLYVPETLGKCEFMVRGVTVPLIRPCEDYLKTFMDITRDDKWIGLLIWQHATAADHMKDDAFTVPSMYAGEEYACAGCKESGEKRAEDEGKPYEDKVYAQSMKNGRKYMELAPGGRYEIHNAGRPGGVSVLWDRSVLGVGNRFSEIIRKAPGIQYVVEAQGAPTPPSRGNMRAETGRVLGEFMKERRAKNETAKAANAKRNAAEGTQEAAAKRLAALRAPSQAEQNTATAEAKKLTLERRAENATRLISEFQDKRGETHIERAARIATSAAKSKTRRNAAIARKDDPTFRLKVAAADRAKAAEAARAAIAERAARAAETRVKNMPVAGERTIPSSFHSMFNRKVNNSQYQPNANPELAGLYQAPDAPFDNFSPVSFNENPLYRPGNALHRNAEAPRQRGFFNADIEEDPVPSYNVSAFPSYRAPS